MNSKIDKGKIFLRKKIFLTFPFSSYQVYIKSLSEIKKLFILNWEKIKDKKIKLKKITYNKKLNLRKDLSQHTFLDLDKKNSLNQNYKKLILKILSCDFNDKNSLQIKINKNTFLKSELLKPTKIYVKEVINLISKNLIYGCANITGGGLADNIKRVVPDNLVADIDLNKIKTLKIFNWLKKNGISENEMLKTFNCGVGFCLIINKKNLSKIQSCFPKAYKPYVIGKIIKGKNKVKLNGSFNWNK